MPLPLVTRAIAGALGLCVAVLAGLDPVRRRAVRRRADGHGQRRHAHRRRKPPSPARRRRPADRPEADAVAPPTALADGDKPPGQTVTIIDGSTGKRQEVTVAQPGSAPATKGTSPRAEAKPDVPIDPRLLETSRHGAIPKIAPDGARPSEIYARPVKPQAGRADQPRVAIVIEGLGIGANSTAEALAKLPAPVTYAFAPYGADLERWVARARGEGHEVLLQVGMEPFDYPDNDPGPQTLLDLASRRSRTSIACTGSSAASRAMSASPA